MGSSLYAVTVEITPLSQTLCESIKSRCSGQVGSLLELLTGKLSKNVIEIVADHKEGLFPKPKEMSFDCSCPDWAGMCKHVAAVLYGIGSRLDEQPELLFTLRNVDAAQLINTKVALSVSQTTEKVEDDMLESIFGIDLEDSIKPVKAKSKTKTKQKKSYDFDKITGKQLKEIREKKKMTVLQFATSLNVTSASVYRWETKDGPLNLRVRVKDCLKAFLV